MKTKHKLITNLAFSAAFLTAVAAMPTARAEMNAKGAEVVTNGPQASPGDSPGSWSTRQNIGTASGMMRLYIRTATTVPVESKRNVVRSMIRSSMLLVSRASSRRSPCRAVAIDTCSTPVAVGYPRN